MAGRTVLVAGASGLIGHAALEQFAGTAGGTSIGISRSVPDDVARRPAARPRPDRSGSVPPGARPGRGRHPPRLRRAAGGSGPAAGLVRGRADRAQRRRCCATSSTPSTSARCSTSRCCRARRRTACTTRDRTATGCRCRCASGRRASSTRTSTGCRRTSCARARRRRWGLTIFRPTVVYGATGHVNMNPLPAIAAYAALQRAAGEPLHFPGTETRRTLREAVDADLVGAGPALGGDVAGCRRRHVQPHERRRVLLGRRVAGDRRDVRHGGRRAPPDVVRRATCPARDAEWAALVARHDLDAPPTIEGFVGANSLVYADVVMAEPRPVHRSSTARSPPARLASPTASTRPTCSSPSSTRWPSAASRRALSGRALPERHRTALRHSAGHCDPSAGRSRPASRRARTPPGPDRRSVSGWTSRSIGCTHVTTSAVGSATVPAERTLDGDGRRRAGCRRTR